ncbi:MAG: R3H domain-containing nucleic acid-binding protein [Acidimicrobiales bacterium]
MVTVERQADIMEGFLLGLLDAFGAAGQVQRARIDDDTIELAVMGDDLGLLIGPKGLTLQAVQDLARTVVQRREPGTHEGRVRIDVSGYRQKRRVALERFVTGIAEDVVRTGTAKALEPMGAADRKVAHDTVTDIDGVMTSSEGQEPRRWVVISPNP